MSIQNNDLLTIATNLKLLKSRVRSIFLISDISYKERITKLQKIILFYSNKKNKSILDITLRFVNREKDNFLKLQFLIAGYELLIDNNYVKN